MVRARPRRWCVLLVRALAWVAAQPPVHLAAMCWVVREAGAWAVALPPASCVAWVLVLVELSEPLSQVLDVLHLHLVWPSGAA